MCTASIHSIPVFWETIKIGHEQIGAVQGVGYVRFLSSFIITAIFHTHQSFCLDTFTLTAISRQV